MIRAEIREDVVTQAGNGTVTLAAYFHGADLRSTMNRRLEVFATCFNPFRRFAELHRDPAEQSFFRINVQLRAKAASDFGRDDAQLIFGNADHQSELRSQ